MNWATTRLDRYLWVHLTDFSSCLQETALQNQLTKLVLLRCSASLVLVLSNRGSLKHLPGRPSTRARAHALLVFVLHLPWGHQEDYCPNLGTWTPRNAKKGKPTQASPRAPCCRGCVLCNGKALAKTQKVISGATPWYGVMGNQMHHPPYACLQCTVEQHMRGTHLAGPRLGYCDGLRGRQQDRTYPSALWNDLYKLYNSPVRRCSSLERRNSGLQELISETGHNSTPGLELCRLQH